MSYHFAIKGIPKSSALQPYKVYKTFTLDHVVRIFLSDWRFAVILLGSTGIPFQ